MKTNMTDDEMRVKIAELCGKIPCYHTEEKTVSTYINDRGDVCSATYECLKCGRRRGALVDDNPKTYIPDYLNDLNAMHEAEKTLTGMQVEWMEEHLRSVVFKATKDDDWSVNGWPSAATKFWHATARQRAIAFLKIKLS